MLELVADGKKKLLDAEQSKVDLKLLMKALRNYHMVVAFFHVLYRNNYGKSSSVNSCTVEAKVCALCCCISCLVP